MERNRSLQRAMLILALAAGLLACAVLLPEQPEARGDCIWEGTAEAWLDINADGIHGPDEPPLPNVKLYVLSRVNGDEDVWSDMVSGLDGRAEYSVLLGGCPETGFVVSARAPSGYAIRASASNSRHARA